MRDENKRTLDELRTLYLLEPEIADLITEGNTDAQIFQWFLRAAQSNRHIEKNDIQVFSVDDRILIDPGDVVSRDLRTGARGRVVASAAFMDEAGVAKESVIFVADADLGYLGYDPIPRLQHLVYTDYTSIELYAFNIYTISKMLSLAFRAKEDEVSADQLLSAVTPALVEMSLARLVLRDFSEGLSAPAKLSRYLYFESDQVRLKGKDFLSAAFSGGAHAITKDCTLESLSAEYSRLKNLHDSHPDPREIINGHDISSLIAYYISNKHSSLFNNDRKNLSNAGVVEKLMVSCLEYGDLVSCSLFRGLIDRFS